MDVSQLIQAAASVLSAQAVGQAASRLQHGGPEVPPDTSATASGPPAAASSPPPASSLAAGLAALLAGGGAAGLQQSPLSRVLAAQQAPSAVPGTVARALEALQQLQSGAQIHQLLLERQKVQQQQQQQALELELLAGKQFLSNLGPASAATTAAAVDVPNEETTLHPASTAAVAPVSASQAGAKAPAPTLKMPSAPPPVLKSQSAAEAAEAEARAEVEKAKLAAKQEQLQKEQEVQNSKCHLHRKPKEGCKFCRRHQELLNSVQDEKERYLALVNAENRRRSRRDMIGAGSDALIEVTNSRTFGLSPTLQAHLADARYYENALVPMLRIEELLEEARQYVKSVEPYMPDSCTMPSPFMCIVYRLFTMGVTGNQMHSILQSSDSPYVRCVGFVYLRFGLQGEGLWSWLGEYITDNEEFQTTAGTSSWTTVGDFVESLLLKEKYFGTLLPRISGGVKRSLEEKLAPVATYRKRMRANQDLLETYRRVGTRVEVCLDGEWHKASTLEVEDHPTRPKVVVRLAGSEGIDEAVHLGMIILVDEPQRGGAEAPRPRSRSRSRERTDWSRHKGKSTSQLVEEMRRAERERAVCSSGKDYGRRPSTFDKGLAMAREGQGVAARKLLEEETYVKASSQRRTSPQPQRGEREGGNRPSAEHQERMRQLFEKYGNVQDKKPKKEPEKGNLNMDEPDKLRLG